MTDAIARPYVLGCRLHGKEWACAVEAGASEGPPVRSVSIRMLLEMTELKRVSILKIDIEGSEKELFSHDVGWLKSIDNIVIELHGDERARELFFELFIPGRPTSLPVGNLPCANSGGATDMTGGNCPPAQRTASREASSIVVLSQHRRCARGARPGGLGARSI